MAYLPNSSSLSGCVRKSRATLLCLSFGVSLKRLLPVPSKNTETHTVWEQSGVPGFFDGSREAIAAARCLRLWSDKRRNPSDGGSWVSLKMSAPSANVRQTAFELQTRWGRGVVT